MELQSYIPASSVELYSYTDEALVAAKVYTDQIAADLLGGAPLAALDTLTEIGVQLDDDKNAIAAIAISLSNKFDTSNLSQSLTSNSITTAATSSALKEVNDDVQTRILQANVSNSVTSIATDTVASSVAVKTAMDNANTRIPTDSISDSVTSVSEDTVASSKAVSTVNSDVQTRIKTSALSNATNSSSSDQVASSMAVKTVMDKVNTMVPLSSISNSLTNTSTSLVASSLAVKNTNDAVNVALTAAKTYADNVKSDLLGGAPAAALDTLVELGIAINSGDSAISALTTTVASKLDKTAKAADSDKLDGLNSTDFARYSASGNISNSLTANAWITGYGGTTNVDHIWHDDGPNEWNFCSDTAFKGPANSGINVSYVKEAGVKLSDKYLAKGSVVNSVTSSSLTTAPTSRNMRDTYNLAKTGSVKYTYATGNVSMGNNAQHEILQRWTTANATVTLSSSAPVGTVVEIINVRDDSGKVTINASGGTIYVPDATSASSHTFTGRGTVRLIKYYSGSNWMVASITAG